MINDDPNTLLPILVHNNYEGSYPFLEALIAKGRDNTAYPTLLYLATQAPDLTTTILENMGLPADGEPEIKAANLESAAAHELPSDFSTFFTLFQEHAKDFEAEVANFFTETLNDPGIISGSWLLATANRPFVESFPEQIATLADKAAVVNFFGNWLPTYNSDWLNEHFPLSDLQLTLYNSDATQYLVDHFNNVGLSTVNDVLHGFLSTSTYQGSVRLAVLTGRLNPTYTPPTVNTPNPANLISDTLYLAEHHLYGSSRLGIKTYDGTAYRNIFDGNLQPTPGITDSSLSIKQPWYSFSFADWIQPGKTTTYTGNTINVWTEALEHSRLLGSKQYELTDHLGNVLATVQDRKSGYGNVGGLYVKFNANVSSLTDYYPFGMMIDGRNVEHSFYRFSHNTQERSDEIAGKGNHHTALFWEYSPRIARRWNVDPVDQISISNYAVNGLNPIMLNDPNGDCPTCPSLSKGHDEALKGMAAGIDKLVDNIVKYWNSPTTNKTAKDIYEAKFNVEIETKGDVIMYTLLNGMQNAFEKQSGTIGSRGGKYRANPINNKSITKVHHSKSITLKNRNPQVGSFYTSHHTKINNGRIQVDDRAVTNGTFDFVVTNEGKLILGKGHYNLSGGAESVKAAGQLQIYRGKIMNINNNSGHYLPTPNEARAYGNTLSEAGVDVSRANLNIYNEKGTKVESTKLN